MLVVGLSIFTLLSGGTVVAQVPTNVPQRALNPAREGCNGIGSPSMRTATVAQFFIGGNAGQINALVSNGVRVLLVIECQKPFNDRDPNIGIVNLSSFVASVDNPTPERMLSTIPLLASLFRGRGTDLREMPVQGMGDQAVGVSGEVPHPSGLQLEYQAIGARAKGGITGTEAKGRPVRRDLLILITSQIVREIESTQ
jgi:hypothetical protein